MFGGPEPTTSQRLREQRNSLLHSLYRGSLDKALIYPGVIRLAK
jgi:hypothetical protein